VISLYDLLEKLDDAVAAADAGDDATYAAATAAFAEGVAANAGAIGGYDVDYVLRDLASALELDEPPPGGAARIRAALDRLRSLGV
jgi:hypothetical protein